MITEEDKGTTITVMFCDGTSQEDTFDPTAWGAISAREQYTKYVEQGKENDTVFAKLPHIVDLKMCQPDNEVHDHFTCNCSDRAEVKGA